MPKRPAKTPPTEAHAAAYGLAQRLSASLDADPSLQLDPVRERPGGLVEANASFEIRDAEGRAFTVIVARTH
jgi:hypothetical protein